MKKHIMVDVETLSSDSNAAVIQIGACVFTKEAILQTLCVNVDWTDAAKHGVISPKTIAWWMEQSPEAKASVMAPGVLLREALGRLTALILLHGEITGYWCHATFDFPVLTNAFKAVGMKQPMPFRQQYDLRTLELLRKTPDMSWPERGGTHHDAGADAEYQAKIAQMLLTGEESR